MPFPLVLTIPGILGLLALLSISFGMAQSWWQQGGREMLWTEIRNWMNRRELSDARREQAEAQIRQLEQQQLLSDRQSALAETQLQYQALWRQEYVARETASTAQATAVAAAIDQMIPTAAGEDEVNLRARQLAMGAGLSEPMVETLTQYAIAGFRERTAAIEEEASSKEKAALSGISTVAGEVEAAVPGLGAIDMAVPLTGAALAALAPTLARSFARSRHTQGIRCMRSTGAAMLGNILKAAIPTGLAAGFMVSPDIQQGMTGIAAKALDILYKPLEDMAPITPEKAPGIGTTLLMQAVLLGSGAHLLSVSAEAVAPLKHMGLGYLSAFMADMAGFSRIAAAFQGTMIQWGLSWPMRYWALQKFRPMMLRDRDFFDLMSREAFTNPESLRTPGLVEAVDSLPGDTGEDKEKQMIGFFGYPDAYTGMFRELANTRLGYFPLAGIARTGWWDREWFEESVQRTGYSATARAALMRMYEEMVRTAKITPCMYQIRRLFREGFITKEQVKEHMANIEKLADLTESRLYAMDLERQYEDLVDLLGIYRYSFANDIMAPEEFKGYLATIVKDPVKVHLYIYREELRRTKAPGMRIPRPTELLEEPPVAPLEIVEE